MANLYAGTDLEQQALANERRRQIAQAMLEQSQQQVQPFQSTGRMVAPMSWTQGIAQLAKAYFAKQGMDKTDSVSEALANQYQKKQDAAVAKYQQTAQGMPETALTPKTRFEGGQAVPQAPQKLEGIPGDQQAATLGLLADPYASPNAREAAKVGIDLSESAKNRAEDQAFRRQQLLLTLEQKEADSRRDAQNAALSVQERADAQRRHDDVLREIASMKAGMGDKPRLGVDQRYNPDTGQAEIIPGSNTWRKQSSLHGKDYEANNALHTKMDLGITKIDEILDPKNTDAFNKNFGGWNAKVTQYAPGDTQNIRKKIDSLKSNMKTAGLELIRSGGSIGQMTEREWPIVEQMIDSIDPVLGEEVARDTFAKIKVYFQTLKDKADAAYQTEWADSPFYKNRVQFPGAEPAVPEFGSEAEAEAAASSGQLKPGQKVKIGGVAGTWQ